jgi:hypothetical protein
LKIIVWHKNKLDFHYRRLMRINQSLERSEVMARGRIEVWWLGVGVSRFELKFEWRFWGFFEGLERRFSASGIFKTRF